MKYQRRNTPAGLTQSMAGGLSQDEVARLLGISRNAVQETENRALRKLATSQLIRRLAVEAGVLPEGSDGAA